MLEKAFAECLDYKTDCKFPDISPSTPQELQAQIHSHHQLWLGVVQRMRHLQQITHPGPPSQIRRDYLHPNINNGMDVVI